jgi:Icc protein
MKTRTISKPTKSLWLSDIHLDQTNEIIKLMFLEKLKSMVCDNVIISGDLSNGLELSGHLSELAETQKTVYFCLGNHDYYGSTFSKVKREIELICNRHKNLIFLGNDEIIPIGLDTVLVGHGGWSDGRAGWGRRTVVESPDHHSIGDFQNLSKDQIFDRMELLGQESAAYFRRVLPYAFSCFSKVIIVTHFPPFKSVTLQHYGKECGRTHLPHYCNQSASVILGIARKFPERRALLLCGHTHHSSRIILDNLEVRVAGAQRGRPAIQGVIEVN